MLKSLESSGHGIAASAITLKLLIAFYKAFIRPLTLDRKFIQVYPEEGRKTSTVFNQLVAKLVGVTHSERAHRGRGEALVSSEFDVGSI